MAEIAEVAATAASKMTEFANLRDGIKTILLEKFTDVENAPKKVQRLERAIYNQSVRIMNTSQQKDDIIKVYLDVNRHMNAYLNTQIGPSEDDTALAYYINEQLSANDLIENSLADEESNPREQIRRLLVQCLYNAHPNYKKNDKLTLETARQIEISCYNASVRISKNSEDPPQRQWSSSAFVDIYSTRCGTILNLIRHNSSSCVTYGPVVISDLISGKLSADNLGNMSASELCPIATESERAEINKRMEQKIDYKVSRLFKCDHCGARECSYQEIQRRALDESPDYMCICLKCNRRFTGRS